MEEDKKLADVHLNLVVLTDLHSFRACRGRRVGGYFTGRRQGLHVSTTGEEPSDSELYVWPKNQNT